jgi:hypothetical protein
VYPTKRPRPHDDRFLEAMELTSDAHIARAAVVEGDATLSGIATWPAKRASTSGR